MTASVLWLSKISFHTFFLIFLTVSSVCNSEGKTNDEIEFGKSIDSVPIFKFSDSMPPLMVRSRNLIWCVREKQIVAQALKVINMQFPYVVTKASCGLPICIHRETGEMRLPVN